MVIATRDRTQIRTKYFGKWYDVEEWTEEIGPDRARSILESHVVNRALNVDQVAKFMDAMLEGYWFYIGEPIHITDEGELLNGQHRLHAVIRAGLTQRFHFVEGLPEDVFPMVDQGAKKNLGHALRNAGAKDPSNHAGIAGWIWKLIHNETEQPEYGFSRGPDNYAGKLFWKYLGGNDGIQEAKLLADRIRKDIHIPTKIGGALKYIHDLQDPGLSDQFWTALHTQEFQGKNDPARKLSTWMMAEYAERKAAKSYGAKNTAFDPIELTAVVHSAWIEYRTGSKLQKFDPPLIRGGYETDGEKEDARARVFETFGDLRTVARQVIEHEHGKFKLPRHQ